MEEGRVIYRLGKGAGPECCLGFCGNPGCRCLDYEQWACLKSRALHDDDPGKDSPGDHISGHLGRFKEISLA